MEMSKENSSLPTECREDTPSAVEYLTEGNWLELTLSLGACVVTAVTIAISLLHFYMITKHVSGEIRSALLICLSSTFAVTSFLATISIIMPRTLVVIRMMIPCYFAAILLGFIALVRDLFGGIAAEARALENTKLVTNVDPFCCCKCLPKVEATRSNLHRAEWMVYQAAIIRPMILFISFLLIAESESFEHEQFNIATSLISLISGTVAYWGANILAENCEHHLSPFRFKMIARFVQIYITIQDIQDPIFEIISEPNIGLIYCDALLHAKNRAANWHHILMVLENLILICFVSWTMQPKKSKVFDRYHLHQQVQQDRAMQKMLEDQEKE